MRSPQKATIIFVATLFLFLFLLPFVSAELDKRDPQAPAGGGNTPAAPSGGNANPPAGGGNTPTAGGGNTPTAPSGGNANPSAGAGPPPVIPAGTPPGGNQPQTGGNPPGGNPPGGNPPGGIPPGGIPGGNSTATNGTTTNGTTTNGTTTNGTATNGTTPKYVDPLTPTVQVQMLVPKTSKNVLYKIGSNITFIWTYSDNFAVQPQFIQVAAQPQVDLNTFYPIATNLSFNFTQQVIWNTSTVSSLPMSQYKLWIANQDGFNATAKPGGLQVFSGLTFGLYSQQPTGTNCDGCNSAVSMQIISLLPTVVLVLITISFSLIS